MPDDMEIAFERHATSKIRSASDLETVKSMGFRGEALASVAAISKIEMISKTADNDVGYKINVQAGKIIDKEEKGCSKGTTITVTDLFFNTPVRYKFLKKDFTEAGYIEDVMTRIALIHPEIAIKLISSGKTIIQTSGNGDIKSIVYNIYGKDIADNIIETNYEYEDIKITGVVGKPAIARSNRGNQMFFVNKRFIKDKTLTSATEQAFKGLLTIGKYGFLILNIEMNPSKVDVNVHPAKLEVRFQDENTIFKAVYHRVYHTCHILLVGTVILNHYTIEKPCVGFDKHICVHIVIIVFHTVYHRTYPLYGIAVYHAVCAFRSRDIICIAVIVAQDKIIYIRCNIPVYILIRRIFTGHHRFIIPCFGDIVNRAVPELKLRILREIQHIAFRIVHKPFYAVRNVYFLIIL